MLFAIALLPDPGAPKYVFEVFGWLAQIGPEPVSLACSVSGYLERPMDLVSGIARYNVCSP